MAKKRGLNIHVKRRFGLGVCFLIGLAFLLLPFSQAVGAPIVIDDMSVQQGSSAIPILNACAPGPSRQDGVTGPAANMVGGARIVEITHTAGDGPCTKCYVNAGVPPSWNVANDPNSTGWGRVVWSGSDTLIDNYGLNLDLCTLDHFNFTYVKADHPTTFTFRVYNNAGQGSEATINFAVQGEMVNVQKAKGDFAAIGGLAAIDWCAPITRITLQFTPLEDIDIAVREIQAIRDIPPPPPPSVPTFTQWGIIGFALLLSVGGLWLIRRRESIS